MAQRGTLYLAGKISGDPYYWTKFHDASEKLKEAGFTVLSPAVLPSEGFEYEAYIRMSTAMLDECDVICFLPDWKESKGAMYEFGRAVAKQKMILYYEDFMLQLEEVHNDKN